MSKKTVLIVGGAGYIGSHVNEMLHRHGYNTIVFDNLSRGSPHVVSHGTLIVKDLASFEAIEQLFAHHSIDAVFHFAALTDVGESVTAPLKYYTHNVGHTLNLLNAMQKHGVRILIFSSTAAIFGNPQALKIAEEHPCEPINPYGASKLLVERMLLDLAKAGEIQFGALRYFNAAGGDPLGKIGSLMMGRKESNLIPILLKNIKQGTPRVQIYGTDYPTRDGTCIRDYIHIEDLGNAHLLLMEKLFSGMESSCFNLGNGEGFTVREVINAVERVTGAKIEAIEVERRAGDPPVLLADSRKAERVLGWKREYPLLEQMIQHAWSAVQPRSGGKPGF